MFTETWKAYTQNLRVAERGGSAFKETSWWRGDFIYVQLSEIKATQQGMTRKQTTVRDANTGFPVRRPETSTVAYQFLIISYLSFYPQRVHHIAHQQSLAFRLLSVIILATKIWLNNFFFMHANLSQYSAYLK